MVDEDLGEATLVYEGPDGDTVETTVENEHLAYFQDHWIVKTDDEAEGTDTIRRIPASRVYHVERDVEAFEEEVGTVLDDVQDVADGVEDELRTLRSRIGSVADGVQSGLLRGGRDEATAEEGVTRIDVETGETVREGSTGSAGSGSADEPTDGPGGREEDGGSGAPD